MAAPSPLHLSAGPERLHALLREGADAAAGVGTLYRIAPGDSFAGTLTAGDSDAVAINLVAGHTYRFDMIGGSLGDTYLRLFDARGNLIGANDDFGTFDHSRLTLTASRSGTYYLVGSGYDDTDTGTYTIAGTAEAAIDPARFLTMPQIADYLVNGFWADQGGARRSFDAGPGDVLPCDLTDLGTAERRVAQMALDAWSGVTGLRFDTGSYAGAAASMRFSNDDTDGAYSVATAGSGMVTRSVLVNIPAGWAGGPGTGWASYYYQTYIHEIGHALGLGHAGNYNGSATYGVDNNYGNDSWQASVMSYFSQTDNTRINASHAFAVTPMIADILAIRSLYGLPQGVNAGNSIWGEGATAGGAAGLANALMVRGEGVTLTILDQGGTDWLKLGSDSRAQSIDLRGGGISSVYGLVGNLSIAQETMIENLIAGSGSDRITGNEAANWLRGMAGGDTIDGGAGADTLEGGAGSDRLAGGAGDDLFIVDAADTVVEAAGGGIDRVRATVAMTLAANCEALLLIQSFARHGTGNALANTIVGNSQVNYLSGAAGNDTLFGMNGDDTLAGNAGADRLVGGAGDDIYLKDSADTVVEAADAGFDTVVTQSDIVLAENVERVLIEGSRDVRVIGNAQANIIVGNAGHNVILGNGGDDTMFGGGGGDVFVFAAGQPGRIGDFQDDIDTIRISAPAVRGFTAAALLADAVERDGGVDLVVAGATLRIDGATVSGLHDDLVIG